MARRRAPGDKAKAPFVKNRRSHKRYTRRLETEFAVGDRIFKGISSDFSEKGLFIRTRNCLTPGSYVEFVIYTPDGRKARGEGIVRRAVKTDSTLVKNGMGIELRRCNRCYLDLLKSLIGEPIDLSAVPAIQEEGEPEPKPVECRILRCPSCGTNNRVPVSRLSQRPVCGRCKSVLLSRPQSSPSDSPP